MTSSARHRASKPHISLLHWVGPPGYKNAIWICESSAQTSNWTYAMGETPRSAYNRWVEERARVQKIRESYLNRGRVHAKGFGA